MSKQSDSPEFPGRAPLSSGTGGLVPFSFHEHPLWYSLYVTAVSVLIGAVAYFVVYCGYLGLARIPALTESLKAIAEVSFTVATTLVPAGFLYLVVLSAMPETIRPGLALPSGRQAWLETAGYAVGAVVLAYVFDYLTGGVVLHTDIGSAAAEAAGNSGGSLSAFSQIVQGHAGFDEAGNYSVQLVSDFGIYQAVYICLLIGVTPIGEEFVCRGIFLPLWRKAFLSLGLFVDDLFKPVAATLAVFISALLFALPHGEALVNQFFFGLVLGCLYLRTGTIWAGVGAHLISNVVVVLIMFA